MTVVTMTTTTIHTPQLSSKRREFFLGLTAGLAVSMVVWLSSTTMSMTTTTMSIKSAAATTKTTPSVVSSVKQDKQLQQQQQQLEHQQQQQQQQQQKQKLIFLHVGKTGGSSGRCMLHPLLTEGSCGRYSNFYQKNVSTRQDTTAIFDQTYAVCHMQGCHVLVPNVTTTSSYDTTDTTDTTDTMTRIRQVRRKSIVGHGIPSQWTVDKMMDWNTGVIVSVRNPIDRIVSWFLYGRQHFFNIMGTPMKGFELQRSKIYRCYTEFADVAEAIHKRSISTTTEVEEEKMRKNKKEKEEDSGGNTSHNSSNAVAIPITGNPENIIDPDCQEAAHRCLVGTTLCTAEHNKYNYKHYLQPLLQKMKKFQKMKKLQKQRQGQSIKETGLSSSRSSSSSNNDDYNDDYNNNNNNMLKVYVVRNEYKWEDFYTINLMLGGTATSFHPSSFGGGQLPHIRNSAGLNKTIPDHTRPALCTILCDEIHEYVAILRRSINLHESQYQQSMDELYASCGLTTVDGAAAAAPTAASKEQQHGRGRLRRRRQLLSSSSSSSTPPPSSSSDTSPSSSDDDPLTELCGTNPYL